MRRTFFLAMFLATVILAWGNVWTVRAGAPKSQTEKRFAFEMRGLGWNKVFEWLSDQSGLPFASKYPAPSGTFNFISPNKNKAPATYSLTEVIDLLNDTLSRDGYLLIRRSSSITLVVNDEEFDAALAPHIEIAELKTRGRTELVSVAVPLDRFGDAGTAREIRKLMGRFGNVVVLAEMKRVVLRDTVENLQRILMITAPVNPRLKSIPDTDKVPQEKNDDREKPIQEAKSPVRVLNHVRLVAISKTPTGNQAVLLDLSMRKREIVLSEAPEFATFQLTDFDGKNKIAIHVLRIDVRDLYFQANAEVYRLTLGESLGTAMAKALSKDELKDLGLKPAGAK